MALTERLALLITADGAGAIKEFNKVGAAAEKELGKAEDRTKKLGSQMQSTGVAMMGAAAVIGAGMYQAGKSAAELEQAVGGTEAVFETSSKVIDEWAKGADKSAGLSEEAARRLTTRLGGALQGLGFAQDEAATKSIELTQIGGDLAATYGGTTADAVQALGSAFRGEFDPLEQFNIFLKQSEVDAKAVSMGLAENTSHVDKNARAQATLAMVMDQSTAAQGQFGREQDTTAGRMAIATAQAENAKAAIGEGFMPVMSKAAGVVGGAATKFSELNEASNGTVSTVASLGVVGVGTAGALSTLIGTTIKMKENFTSAGEKLKGMDFAGAAAKAGILAAAFALAGKDIENVLKSVKETQEGIFKNVDFTEGIDATDAKLRVAGKSVDDLASKWNSYNRIEQMVHHAEGASYDAALDQINEYSKKLESSREILEHLSRTTGISVSELDRLATSAKIDPSTVGYDKLLPIMQGLKDGTLDAAQAQAGLKKATGDTKGATEDLGKAAEDASKKAKSAWDDAKKAIKGYYDQVFGTVDAQRNVVDAQRGLIETVVENNKTAWGAFDLSTQAGSDNQKAFSDAAKAVLEYGQRQTEAGVPQAENTRMVQDQIAKLREQAIAHGISANKVDDYIAKLGLTPPQIETKFNAPGLDEARQNAERLANALGSAASQISSLANSGKGGGTLFGSTINLGFRAAGGPVDSGRPYVVGENGPELMVPGASGAVLNRDQVGQVAAAAGGSSAPGEIHTHVYIDGREIVTAISNYEGSRR